ncbi:ankyrin repeat domain-containing protein [Tolypothrix sp. PCC 7910]|uniref:ankyrin repeat domain-containing protein n=1 Tax=Tolypothrix sp. PCC 7910 TaxID=2099387 RepID=UPI0014278741|nr:ankyrin repeat domain-containing protein [Tolypothrix sp. PCC 7910]QIR36108.1 ankyrin repeat domain-containing protein [Tolypothrix sp. PCC 7910]
MKIHDYAIQGNIAGVRGQLTKGVDIERLDKSAQTPLMCAVSSADASLEMVQFLVENGADINAIGGDYNSTVLGFAIQSGNFDKIKYLVERGVNIHAPGADGCDVLIDAIYSQNISSGENLISILRLLIARGADLRKNQYGASALTAAAYLCHFDVVDFLLKIGADREQLQWTKLMYAIVFGSVEEVKQLIDAGEDLEAWDCCNRTPWILSLQVGNIDKAKLLLPSPVERNKYLTSEEPELMYAIKNNHLELLEWLIDQGFDVETADHYGTTPLVMAAERGATDCVRILLEAGADASRCEDYNRKAINSASNLEIVKLLVDAGEDLSDINEEMQQLLTGLSCDREISNINREQYLSGKYPRFGTANPEIMKIEFWHAMVRSHVTAYTARNTFNNGDNTFEDEAVWCFQRFGRTITQLPDGRIIQIAGEHEDYYDPDFCIYNDVVVFQNDGTFTIFGYPQEVFPPTDFHSATLVGDYIYIIGNLGYSNARIYGETPVYCLNWHTLKIEKIETAGEKPGWISRHRAFYRESSKIYITGGKICTKIGEETDYIDNQNSYILDLKNMYWSKVII